MFSGGVVREGRGAERTGVRENSYARMSSPLPRALDSRSPRATEKRIKRAERKWIEEPRRPARYLWRIFILLPVGEIVSYFTELCSLINIILQMCTLLRVEQGREEGPDSRVTSPRTPSPDSRPSFPMICFMENGLSNSSIWGPAHCSGRPTRGRPTGASVTRRGVSRPVAGHASHWPKASHGGGSEGAVTRPGACVELAKGGGSAARENRHVLVEVIQPGGGDSGETARQKIPPSVDRPFSPPTQSEGLRRGVTSLVGREQCRLERKLNNSFSPGAELRQHDLETRRRQRNPARRGSRHESTELRDREGRETRTVAVPGAAEGRSLTPPPCPSPFTRDCPTPRGTPKQDGLTQEARAGRKTYVLFTSGRPSGLEYKHRSVHVAAAARVMKKIPAPAAAAPGGGDGARDGPQQPEQRVQPRADVEPATPPARSLTAADAMLHHVRAACAAPAAAARSPLPVLLAAAARHAAAANLLLRRQHPAARVRAARGGGAAPPHHRRRRPRRRLPAAVPAARGVAAAAACGHGRRQPAAVARLQHAVVVVGRARGQGGPAYKRTHAVACLGLLHALLGPTLLRIGAALSEHEAEEYPGRILNTHSHCCFLLFTGSQLNEAYLKNCRPITTVGDKNKCLESTSPPNEYAKYSWLYLQHNQSNYYDGLALYYEIFIMQNTITTEYARIRCDVLWCNFMDFVKLSFHEAEEFPGSRTSAGLHENSVSLCLREAEEYHGSRTSAALASEKFGVITSVPKSFHQQKKYEYTVDFNAISTHQQFAYCHWWRLLEKAFSYLTGTLRVRQHRHGSYVIRVQTVKSYQKINLANQDRRQAPIGKRRTAMLRASNALLLACVFGVTLPTQATVSLLYFLNTYYVPSTWLRGRGGVVVRLLASHLAEPGLVPSGVAFGFSHGGIVPDDASVRRVFSGISLFLTPLHSGAAPYSPRITLIDSQDLDVTCQAAAHPIAYLSSYAIANQTKDPVLESRATCQFMCTPTSDGFLGNLPLSPPLHSGAAPFSSHFTLIGSQYVVVKSRPNHSQPLHGGRGEWANVPTLCTQYTAAIDVE
ncbi:hypothetical protein PR048_028946 [Dryococelus australis]|uniref:Uncharacterized protein n=1 Tax=Dryococelus australis TaxID=614101 RepID=A0ABQ9GBZ5_9NEOP|nr:hypothetical protein PR048_028946 [Dryococelus australis]